MRRRSSRGRRAGQGRAAAHFHVDCPAKVPNSSTRTDSSTATTHPALFLLSFNLAALFVQHLSATELEPEPEPGWNQEPVSGGAVAVAE